jgi:hypothetical protein
MYKKITLKDFKILGKKIPNDMNLWLTDETIDSLKRNICSKDLQNVRDILYREFLKRNNLQSAIIY